MDKMGLVDEIGKFLRTHQNGGQRLLDWLVSVPPDRTEEEYARLREQWDAEELAQRQESVDRFNAAARARGGNEIDIHGDVIAGPGAPRNLEQTAKARAEYREVAALLARKDSLTAEQILQILGWPESKKRAVERHMSEWRKS